MDGPTVSLRYVQKLLETAKTYGVSTEELCNAAEIDVPVCDDPAIRVPASRFVRLWTLAMDRLRDPGFPLRVAEAMDDSTMHVLGFSLKSSATLGDAFERLQRYLPIMTNSARQEITRSEGHAHLTLVRDVPWRVDHRFVDEFALAQILIQSRTLSGVRWLPTEVRFQHLEPDDTREHRALFGCPLRFSCDRTELYFEESFLSLPLLKADAAMSEFFDNYIETILERVYPARSFLVSLKRAIRDALSSGDCSIKGAAKSLGLSARTLQRRLRQEKVGYRQLLDLVRSDLAKHHLDERRLAVAEISFLLGYSEPAAFYRAFRRWTGTTPDEHRGAYLSLAVASRGQ